METKNKVLGTIRVLYWEIKMDFLETFRYRFGLITDLVVYLVLITIFILSDSGKGYVEVYEYENYKAMVLLGYIAWIYASSAVSDVSGYMSAELVRGTFYKKLLSKYSLQTLFFGLFISSVLLETVVIIVVTAFSTIIFQIKLSINLLQVMAILIGTIGMYGIGLIIAGLSMYFKRTGSIVFLVQTMLLFVSDTIPTKQVIRNLAMIFPLTRCNEILKIIVVGPISIKLFGNLILCSVIWLIVGIGIFNALLKKAKKRGNLLFF